MQNPQGDESLPTDKPGLETRLLDLEAQMQDAQAFVQALMAKEDPERGIFHAEEIHKTKQHFMMLRYQQEVCLARLRTLSH